MTATEKHMELRRKQGRSTTTAQDILRPKKQDSQLRCQVTIHSLAYGDTAHNWEVSLK